MNVRQHIETEKALKKKSKFLHNIMATVPDSLLVLDRYLVIKSANRSFYTLFQTEPKKIMGSKIAGVLGDKDGELSAKLAGLFGDEDMLENFELRYHSKKLGARILNITGRGIVIAEEQQAEEEEEEELLVVIQDITERKQIEETLRQSERRYKTLVETAGKAGEGIAVVQDIKGQATVVFLNSQLTDMLGYTCEELMGKPVWEFLSPESVPMIQERYERRQKGEAVPVVYETTAVRKDGKVLPIEVAMGITTFGGKVAIVAYVRDITERKQAEEKAQQMEFLKGLDKARRELLSNVSHELRTPLAVIKGYASMIKRYDMRLSNREKRRHLTSIDKAADRLTELIAHLLDMSRLEVGVLVLNKRPTHIRKLLEEAVHDGQITAPRHNIRLEVTGRLPRLNVDPRRIRQVLDNIIDNAIRYSNEGTMVKVEAQLTGSELLISVVDQGTGIPADELTKIFIPFYRIEKGLTREIGGTGLGLAICTGLIEKHGGRIWAESKLGKGSTFRFALPLDATKE